MRLWLCVLGTVPRLLFGLVDPFEVDILGQYFLCGYGPLEMKQQALDWDFSERIDSLKTLELKNFRSACRALFLGTMDHHVSVTFYSTEFSTLPFEVKKIEDAFYVSWVESQFSHCLRVGSQIISWNRVPIATVFSKYVDENWPISEMTPTFLGRAEQHFTRRLGEIGMACPQGGVELTYLVPGARQPHTLYLRWHHGREAIPTHQAGESYHIESPQPSFLQCHGASAIYFERSYPGDLRREQKVGAKRGFLPMVGTPIWTSGSESVFFAYLSVLPDGKCLGTIRIASFEDTQAHFREFNSLVHMMERSADTVLLDVTNNPGGSFFALLHFLSVLSPTSLEIPKEVMKIHSEDVYMYARLLALAEDSRYDEGRYTQLKKEMRGYSIPHDTLEGVRRYCRHVLHQWAQGESVTHQYAPLGIEKVLPDRDFVLTKPLLIAIDAQSYSCAELLPLILQMNGRAQLIGEQTGGSIGLVTSPFKFPNHLGIESFMLTKSVVYDPFGNLLEGKGTQPDFPYSITSEDIKGEYKDYKNFIESILSTGF